MIPSFSKFIAVRNYSIAIIGPPASGKGTISAWMSRDFQATHISMGQLLKQSATAESQALLNQGQLSNDEPVLSLLLSNLKQLNGGKFCLDGFPRRRSQAEALDRLYPNLIEAVILLNVPEDVLIHRLTDRWVHAASGRSYSYSFSPPKIVGFDDLTGEALIQRPDDVFSTFKQRMRQYNQHLSDIQDYYQDRLFIFKGNNSREMYSKILQHESFNDGKNIAEASMGQ